MVEIHYIKDRYLIHLYPTRTNIKIYIRARKPIEMRIPYRAQRLGHVLLRMKLKNRDDTIRQKNYNTKIRTKSEISKSPPPEKNFPTEIRYQER